MRKNVAGHLKLALSAAIRIHLILYGRLNGFREFRLLKISASGTE